MTEAQPLSAQAGKYRVPARLRGLKPTTEVLVPGTRLNRAQRRAQARRG